MEEATLQVRRHVPLVSQVLENVGPGGASRLLECVLYDTHVVRTRSIVKTESHDVWHGPVHTSNVQLSIVNFLVEVEAVNFCELSVDGATVIPVNSGLLVCVMALVQLHQLTHKHSVVICRVRSSEKSHIGVVVKATEAVENLFGVHVPCTHGPRIIKHF